MPQAFPSSGDGWSRTDISAGATPAPAPGAGGAERMVLPFGWDMVKLHSLHPPVRTLPVAELRWQLAWKVWSHYGAPFLVSPVEVRRDPRKYAVQYARVMAADLAYPLYVVRWGSRWTILDGVHRLLKAEILGWDTVEVYVLEPEQLAAIMVPPTDEAMTKVGGLFEYLEDRSTGGLPEGSSNGDETTGSAWR